MTVYLGQLGRYQSNLTVTWAPATFHEIYNPNRPPTREEALAQLSRIYKYQPSIIHVLPTYERAKMGCKKVYDKYNIFSYRQHAGADLPGSWFSPISLRKTDPQLADWLPEALAGIRSQGIEIMRDMMIFLSPDIWQNTDPVYADGETQYFLKDLILDKVPTAPNCPPWEDIRYIDFRKTIAREYALQTCQKKVETEEVTFFRLDGAHIIRKVFKDFFLESMGKEFYNWFTEEIWHRCGAHLNFLAETLGSSDMEGDDNYFLSLSNSQGYVNVLGNFHFMANRCHKSEMEAYMSGNNFGKMFFATTADNIAEVIADSDPATAAAYTNAIIFMAGLGLPNWGFMDSSVAINQNPGIDLCTYSVHDYYQPSAIDLAHKIRFIAQLRKIYPHFNFGEINFIKTRDLDRRDIYPDVSIFTRRLDWLPYEILCLVNLNPYHSQSVVLQAEENERFFRVTENKMIPGESDWWQPGDGLLKTILAPPSTSLSFDLNGGRLPIEIFLVAKDS